MTTTFFRQALSSMTQVLLSLRQKPFASACFFIILAAFLCGIFAPYLPLHDPLAMNLSTSRLLPPAWISGQWNHPLGTDNTGRDLLARLIYGARLSMVMGLLPLLLALGTGVPVGLLTGYCGGTWVDKVFMRFAEVVLAFPALLLALVVIAILGPGFMQCMLAVGVVTAPQFAFVTRSAVLAERGKEYVVAAVAQGMSPARLLYRHLIPNVTGGIIIVASLQYGVVLLEMASLSFLGLGIPPPTPEWGAMLADGKNYFIDGWWMILFPGMAIFLVVMACNAIAEAAKDILYPG